MSASASPSEHVAVNYDALMGPVMFEAYAKETATRIPPSRYLLEIGAGTGRVTAHLLSKIAEGGRLLATDLNDDMLEVAMAKIKDPRVIFAVADAHDLPYDDREFDNIVCQYVAMFFKDRGLAYSEFKRVLKPGGSLVMAVWGSTTQNPWGTVAQDAANHFLPEDQKIESMSKPFSYCDEIEVTADLYAAGFEKVSTDWVHKEFRTDKARDFMEGMFKGSLLTSALEERGHTDVEHMIDFAAQKFREKFGNPAVSTMSTLYITAR